MSYTEAPGITIEIDQKGRLEFVATDEGVQWLKDNRGERSDYDVFCELLESSSCNSGFTMFDAGDANPFVGLTSAPCIAETMSSDEDGKKSIEGRLWYFERYQLDDMVDVLIDKGRLSFDLGPSQEAAPAPRRPRP